MNDQILQGLFRNNEYLSSLYIIKEEVQYSNTLSKIYAKTKEKNYGAIITKQSKIQLNSDIFKDRLIKTVKLIEKNLLLVENLWLQESSNDITLYISEFTKADYRNDFNLVTFSYYFHELKSADLNTSITILLNLLKKIQILHKNNQIPHLNISPLNIYINKTNLDVYLGPCKISDYDEWNIWYLPPEYCYIQKFIEDDIKSGIASDIWSIGCIMIEMFFIVCPLFQAYSLREKMKKIIEVLGVPISNNIDYMTKQEYTIFQSTGRNLDCDKGTIYDIPLYNNEGNESKKEIEAKKLLFQYILLCFDYNRFNRISVDDLINNVEDIKNNLSNMKPMKKGVKNIINQDNLLKENAPLNIDNSYTAYINYSNYDSKDSTNRGTVTNYKLKRDSSNNYYKYNNKTSAKMQVIRKSETNPSFEFFNNNISKDKHNYDNYNNYYSNRRQSHTPKRTNSKLNNKTNKNNIVNKDIDNNSFISDKKTNIFKDHNKDINTKFLTIDDINEKYYNTMNNKNKLKSNIYKPDYSLSKIDMNITHNKTINKPTTQIEKKRENDYKELNNRILLY